MALASSQSLAGLSARGGRKIGPSQQRRHLDGKTADGLPVVVEEVRREAMFRGGDAQRTDDMAGRIEHRSGDLDGADQTFLARDGVTLLPDDLQVTIELPAV